MEKTIFNCPHCGRIISKDALKGNFSKPKVACPECSSQRNFRDGKRKTTNGTVQLYRCRDCGKRFTAR